MSYPKIEDDDFYKRINQKYKKFEIEKKRKPFRQICFPKDFQLQIPQKFLASYINPKTPYKGILIFHRIGAGKTCTAVNIAEGWKEYRKIVVALPASLIGNFRNELRSLCAGNAYLSQKEREKLKQLHPASDEYKDIIWESDKKIDKHYSIYSYNKFVKLAEAGKMNLKNSVLIVDEVQNMVSETGKYYEVLYDTIHNAPASLRVVLLSATPMFDKPIEIALTMNLLRIPYEFPTGKEFERMFIETKCRAGQPVKYNAKNMDMFKEMIKGYVSYYRGAPPYVFPESTVRVVKCEMSDFQYKSYLAVLSDEEKSKSGSRLRGFQTGEITELPNSFFIGTRMISNIAFPNKDVSEEGYYSLKGKNITEKLDIYSTKFYKILNRIKASKGPIFVYSNFKEYGGIKSFVKVLNAHGYRDYINAGEGRKRYAVWTGDAKYEDREEIKAVFNQKSNYNGSKIKIILGSPSTKEGISFFNVRQVHILEPYWNYSRILQIIGRAVRYCSHKNLPKDERNVKVYIYLATHEYEKMTIDQYIMNLAMQKNRLIQQFETALKEVAVDCSLFKNANVFKDDPNAKSIKCQT